MSRGRPGKREAITTAARLVFGRDGYSRSSVDAIAAEAGVSTRTIYNHFDSKEQLFTSVLQASATQVADAFVDKVSTIDGGATDLESNLVGVADALALQASDFPEHFAMVRQINAEAGHFPSAVIDAWMEAGPLRVEREVARHLSELAADGRLVVPDADRAARHFVALVASEMSGRAYRQEPVLTAAVRSGRLHVAVDAFLHGYGR